LVPNENASTIGASSAAHSAARGVSIIVAVV
jgi:hypothetical protein